MTDVATALPAAGWYDDPSTDDRLRWWDGTGWTVNSMPKDAPPVPTAPPLGRAYSIDEDRVAASPRRSARAAGQDHIAPVTPLHPAQDDAPLEAPELTGSAAEPVHDLRPAEPQPVVPPVAEARAAAPTASSNAHLPQLGLVPDTVDAVGATDVVATGPTSAAGATVPQPGTFVAGPVADLDTERPAPAMALPSAIAAPAEVDTAAPAALPGGLPASPEQFLLPAEPVAPTAPRRLIAMSGDPSGESWWEGLLPTTSVTSAAVLLALAPLAAIATALGALWILAELPQFALALAALPLLSIVMSFVLAVVDRRRLRRLGWARSASAAWMLLGPMGYLVARQVVLGRQGARTVPLMIAAVIVALVVAVAVIAGPTVLSDHMGAALVMSRLPF